MKYITRFVKQKKVELIVLFYILVVLVTGLSMQSFNDLIQGLWRIFNIPGALITDYMVVGGMGPAFVNGALVALIGYFILVINKISFTGISIAAIFTMMGFGLMGKDIVSILPILFGVYLYSKIRGEKYAINIYSGLFGTALAPLVAQVSIEFGWGIPGGIVIGTMAGLVISPLAKHSITFHKGYNLYNVGFSAGFIGIVFMSVLQGHGYQSKAVEIWGTEYDDYLKVFISILFLSMIIIGIIDLVTQKGRLKDYIMILKQPGTLRTDFILTSGFASTLINMGLVGLTGLTYILLVGGNLNGPSLSGLFTMVGFAAYGKHIKNVIPIMIGVWLGAFVSIHNANAPGPLIAGLFGTALAPMAGRFGPIVGIITGFLHFYVVSIIGVVHGGLNLYNNGFSAGFIGAFMIAIITEAKRIKKDA